MLSNIKKSTKTVLSALAVGSMVAATSLAPAPAMARGFHGGHHGFHHGFHHGHWGGHRHWGGHHDRWYHDGAGVAAGLVGAAIIGSAIANANDYNNSCYVVRDNYGNQYRRCD